MDIVIKKLYSIKNQPIIHIGRKSVILLRAYIDGYIAREMEVDLEFRTIFYEFYDFIQKQYEMAPNHYWDRILFAFSSTDEDAFELFYKYLDEFLQSKNIDPNLE